MINLNAMGFRELKKCMHNFYLLTNNVFIYLVRNSMRRFIVVCLCVYVCICVCLYVCPYICLSVKKGDVLTHYHIMTQFYALKINNFRKYCEKREKLLVTSNFSFSHNFFYPMWYLFSILIAV